MKLLTLIKIFFITSLITCCSYTPMKKFSFFEKHCSNNYDENYKGHYKVGKPYQIKNIWYYPAEDHYYNKIGLASWYGDAFHCKKTSNGEFFNKRQLSAAHKTLPIPSIAKVTNLSNNRSVIVIVNDRGPFVNNRIIDLSEEAAEVIDTKHKGVAQVRVEYLHNETNILLAQLKMNKHIKHVKNKNQQNIHLIKANNSKNFETVKKVSSTSQLENIKPDNLLPQEAVISVGIYHSQADAIASVKRLSNLGIVKFSQFFQNNKPLYEVHFSKSITSPSQAESTLKKIINLGHQDAYLVKN